MVFFAQAHIFSVTRGPCIYPVVQTNIPPTGGTRAISEVPLLVNTIHNGTEKKNLNTDLQQLMRHNDAGNTPGSRGFRREFCVAKEQESDERDNRYTRIDKRYKTIYLVFKCTILHYTTDYIAI